MDDLRQIRKIQERILDELEILGRTEQESSTIGQKLADRIVRTVGSWQFIIGQSLALGVWIAWNVATDGFDKYPFILLNLMLSFQAAFASPIILMASNRVEEKDRKRAITAYRTIERIEEMLRQVDRKASKVRKRRHD